MRKFKKKRELVRPGVTRFATTYLSLQSMYKKRIALRSMFASKEWSRCRWSRDAKGKKTRDIILSKYFWRGVLRLVDADKPSMGFIYDAMERAKNEIAENFDDDTAKYVPIWEIIDDKWDRQLHRPLHASKGVIMNGFNECLKKLVPNPNIQDKISIEELIPYKCSLISFGNDMALRQINKDEPGNILLTYVLLQHGSSAPNLQKMAMRILRLATTSSGCERNWISFEMLLMHYFSLSMHTKRRNRLEQRKLNDLVFVRENQRLKEKKNQLKKDRISSKDMENASDWLVSDPGTEEVFPGEGLTWAMVKEASGQVYDPRRATRATSSTGTSQREIEEEEADSEESLEEEEYVEEGDDSDDDGLNSDADEGNEDDDSDSY
ncbi:hypothetical protein AMTRI_Chr03g144300 [Amborella trichopoda]